MVIPILHDDNVNITAIITVIVLSSPFSPGQMQDGRHADSSGCPRVIRYSILLKLFTIFRAE